MHNYFSKLIPKLSIGAFTFFTVIPLSSMAVTIDKESMGPKPNLQMQAVLDELAKLAPKPLGSVSAIEARKQPTPADAVKALLQKQGKATTPQEVGSVVDKSIDGLGGKIAIRVYTPKGKGPFPIIVYYHGGGWVIADLDVYDATPRAMVNAANAIVISSHYRQGPEHKFPAAHDDALSTYKWALQNAKELNGEQKKIAVMGESAGGNLAAAVSILAFEQKLQMPVHQVLIYPIAGYDFNTNSYIENAQAKPLGRLAMQWFFSQYLNKPAEGKDYLISLVNHKNLKGLPSATVVTAQLDPLRTEGKQYAENLKKAGIDVRYKNYEGVAHEFFGMASVIDEAKNAQKFAADGLIDAF